MEKKIKKFNKKSWITSSLRRMSYRYPARNEAIKLARVDRGRYKCAMCEGIFSQKEIAVDHINPVVPYEGFPKHPTTGQDDWTIFIDRLFCETEGFQILCDACHDSKTQIEDSMRASYNQKRKLEEKNKIKTEKKLAKLNKKV